MEYKLIFNAGVARHLLKAGNPIVDIRQDKKIDNSDKTIFVFEKTEKLLSGLASAKSH